MLESSNHESSIRNKLFDDGDLSKPVLRKYTDAMDEADPGLQAQLERVQLPLWKYFTSKEKLRNSLDSTWFGRRYLVPLFTENKEQLQKANGRPQSAKNYIEILVQNPVEIAKTKASSITDIAKKLLQDGEPVLKKYIERMDEADPGLQAQFESDNAKPKNLDESNQDGMQTESREKASNIKRTTITIGGGASTAQANLHLSWVCADEFPGSIDQNYILSHLSGSYRTKDSGDSAKTPDMNHTVEIMMQALNKLNFKPSEDGILLNGFSAGGQMALVLARALADRYYNGDTKKIDLILIDSTGMVENPKLEQNFAVDSVKSGFDRMLQGWVTRKGKPKFLTMVKEFVSPMSTITDIAGKFKEEAGQVAKPGPVVSQLNTDTTAEIRERFKGRVVMVPMMDADVTNTIKILYEESGDKKWSHLSDDEKQAQAKNFIEGLFPVAESKLAFLHPSEFHATGMIDTREIMRKAMGYLYSAN